MLGKSVIIFLHGSGGTGTELRTYLSSVPLSAYKYRTFQQVIETASIELITPTAPYRPYTAMGGEETYIWFDRSMDFIKNGLNDIEDIKGNNESISIILNQLHSIADNYDHLFLGGFSMGGGLSLQILRHNVPKNLRGIFCLSSFLHNDSIVFNTHHSLGDASKLPVLMMHGENDHLINHEWGKKTAANLVLRGIDVQFRSYHNIDHEINDEELSDLFHWMEDIILQYPKNNEMKESNRRELYDMKHDDDSKFDTKTSFDEKYHDEKGFADEVTELRKGVAALQTQSINEMKIPYTLQYINTELKNISSSSLYSGSSNNKVCIHYQVPRSCVSVLTSRPVLACGSIFEIEEDTEGQGGVKTTLSSMDPDKTAIEIGLRLQNRLAKGSASLNPCAMN